MERPKTTPIPEGQAEDGRDASGLVRREDQGGGEEVQGGDKKKSWRQAVTDLHARDARRYPVSVLCGLLDVSKQAYYKRDENADLAKAAREEFALQYISEVRAKDSGIGGMKLWHMYRREFGAMHPMGRDRFEELINRRGLKVRRRVRAPRTTDSSHGLPTYPNLVRDFIPTAPNRLWVSDITYITVWLSETVYVFCYLSLVMDAYTEEIVGWSVGETLDANPIEALRTALKRIEGIAKENVNLMHHSDRGCQYASGEYVRLLAANGIRVSMTESGDPKENAQAEHVNGSMKNELFKGRRFRSVEEVRAAVSDAVAFYNNKRPHMSIGMMIPAEASCLNGELEKKWKSYRSAAIKTRHGTRISRKKVYLCRAVRSLLPGYALQSTSDWDKSMECQPLLGINKNSQPISVLITKRVNSNQRLTA